MIKYIYIAVISAFLILSLTTYFLWSNNKSLRAKNNELTSELTITKDKLKDALSMNTKIQIINKDLSKTVNTYKLEAQNLQSKLSKLELKADKISSKHPKLLEDAINKGTKEVNLCFERISKGEVCETD